MTSGVIGRAREKIPAQGDYLDKDELVRSGVAFGIVAGGVVWDETGSSYGPRWVVTVEPWYEEDAEIGPHGVLTMKDTNIRNAIMNSLADEADQLQAGDMLGPIVLIKALSANKYRYYDFADYDEETGQAVGANGRKAEPELPTPPPSSGRRPSRPATPARPAAQQAHQSTGQRERAQQAAKPAPAAPEAAKTRGRPRRAATTTPEPAPPAAAGPQGAPSAQGAEAAQAQQISSTEIQVGTANCPFCGDENITARAFPDAEGNPVIIHRCRAQGGKSIPLPADIGGE